MSILPSIVEGWWSEFLLVALTTLFTATLYVRHLYSYWDRRGLVSVPGTFPCGSLTDFIFIKKTISEVYRDIYKKGDGHKIIGYYSFLSPALVIRDLDLIRHILIKDHSNFTDRGSYYNEKDDPLSAHIFSLDGQKWKNVRAKLSPTYTSGKMKFMYETMRACVHELETFLKDLIKDDSEIEIREIVSKFGINVIARTAVGIEGHNLKEDSQLSKMAFKVTDPNDIIQAFRFTLPFVSRNVAAFFRMRFTPKEVSDYYMDIVEKIMDYREKSGIIRNDFMQLLIEMDKKSQNSSGIGTKTESDKEQTIKDVAAQTFVFILAGHETLASTITFCLYEMAVNPEVQDKLIEEVDSTGLDINDITYEKIHELPYLDTVLNETLRKYPPAGILIRQCVSDYTTPDGFTIKKGTYVQVPVLGLHHDPKLFPDPEKFDPHRFNKDFPSQVIEPFSYLPFGEGPRFCIGMRFAKMEWKLTIFTIFSKFRVFPSEKTQIPPRIEPKLFIMSPKDGLFLRFTARHSSKK